MIIFSGQEVVGPPRRDPDEDDDDVTSRLFRAARAHGAEPVPSDGAGSSRGGPASSVRFVGGGYKLGDNVVPSSRIATNAASAEVDDDQPAEVGIFEMLFLTTKILS